jgi:MFS family permease
MSRPSLAVEAMPGPASTAPGAAFQRLWHATAASALGNGIQRALVPLLAALASHDPVVIGLVIACGRLPWLVLGLHAGRWIDRHSPGRVATVGAMVRLVGASLLTIFWLGPWQGTALLCLLVFVVAAGEVLGDVAAQTWVAHLAPPAAYPVAYARIYGTQVLLGQLAGPAVAGFLLSLAAPFATGAAALLQAVSTLGLRQVATGRPTAPPAAPLAAVAEGSAWALVRADRCLLGIVALGALSMAVYGMWTTAIVLFVTDPQGLNLPASRYGLLMATAALGSLLGSAVMPRVLRASNGFVCVAASCVGVSLLALGPACSRSIVATGLALFAYGLLLSAWNVSAVSFRQKRVPIGMLGRVTAFYRLAAWGAMPIGAAVAGLLCAQGGTRPVFWACVALSMLQYPLLRLVRELRGYRG